MHCHRRHPVFQLVANFHAISNLNLENQSPSKNYLHLTISESFFISVFV